MKALISGRPRVLLALSGVAAVVLAGCNDDNNGGPSAGMTATPVAGTTATPVAGMTATPIAGATATATPVANSFRARYTGTYRTVSPATGEVGTLLFNVADSGAVVGSFASPFGLTPIPVTGSVSGAGVLQASGVAAQGTDTLRIAINATLSRQGNRILSSGTFSSTSPSGTVRGTFAGRAASPIELSLYNGTYSGSFVNAANTAQNGVVTATVVNGDVTAKIQVPGIGLVNGSGILDLSTGQVVVTAPFQIQNTTQFLSLSGRLSRSTGGAVVGTGTFRSSAGGRGTFRVAKDAAR